MVKFQSWVSAARLRTLPLSISGILMGTAIAANQDQFNIEIFCLSLATTLGLQILSNFANDYGDFVKGTDNAERVGPERALQSGLISEREMLFAMVSTAFVTLLVALALIYVSFGTENISFSLFFILLGVAAIVAAVKYTVGSSAYGYKGLGDIFVFIFFGMVGVYGSYFLYTHEWDWKVLLPASAVGFLSTGVLNLNNMRDRIPDEAAGKNTLVVQIGPKKAKLYHYFLILSSFAFLILYSAFTFNGIEDIMYVIAYIPLLFHLKRVMNNQNPQFLDAELKVLALSTFFLTILFALGQVW